MKESKVAHTAKCGNAQVIPWTQCTCDCDGVRHPPVPGFYHRTGRVGKQSARYTAIPGETPTERDAINVFALSVKILADAQAETDVGIAICERLGHSFRLPCQRKKAPTDIPGRQVVAKALLELVRKLDEGGDLDAVEQAFVEFVFGSAEVGSLLLRSLALWLCGYLGDTHEVRVVSETVEILRLPLLFHHVVGEPARTVGDLAAVGERLAEVPLLTRVIEEVETLLSDLAHGPANDGHFLCSLLLLMVEILSIPDELVDAAAHTMTKEVEQKARFRTADDRTAEVMGAAAGQLVAFLGSRAVEELGVDALKRTCQLLAVACCPSLHDHPEITTKCLVPLAESSIKDFVKAEVRQVFYGPPVT